VKGNFFEFFLNFLENLAEISEFFNFSSIFQKFLNLIMKKGAEKKDTGEVKTVVMMLAGLVGKALVTQVLKINLDFNVKESGNHQALANASKDLLGGDGSNGEVQTDEVKKLLQTMKERAVNLIVDDEDDLFDADDENDVCTPEEEVQLTLQDIVLLLPKDAETIDRAEFETFGERIAASVELIISNMECTKVVSDLNDLKKYWQLDDEEFDVKEFENNAKNALKKITKIIYGKSSDMMDIIDPKMKLKSIYDFEDIYMLIPEAGKLEEDLQYDMQSIVRKIIMRCRLDKRDAIDVEIDEISAYNIWKFRASHFVLTYDMIDAGQKA